MIALGDQQLRKRSLSLRYRAKSGEPLMRLLVEGYALVREAGRRLDLTHHASRHAGPVGNHLECHRPLELAVVRLVHFGEATGAHLAHDLVALRPVYVEGGTAVGHDRHGSLRGSVA